MAQGFTDFAGNTPGATPPTDWTPRWSNQSDWTTGTGPALERPGAGSADYAAITWEVPGSVSGNKEIVVRVRTSDTGGLTVGAVMDVQPSGDSGYHLTLSFGTELTLIRLDSGVGTAIGSSLFTFAADTDYWVRLGRNGNDLRFQVWAASGSDPGGWLATVTDSTYTTGRMGVAARAGFPTVRCTQAGYGTAGDAAPTAPVPTTPSLSAPTPSGTLGTLNTATVGATTSQDTGTLFVVVDTVANLAGVTAAQIKLGQRASGAAAFQAGSSAVSTTSPSVAISGLAAATTYGYAIVQNNANGDSNVVTGSFTTASTVVPVITDAGDEIFLDGETGTLVGSGFLAVQGAGAVFLSPTNNVNDPNRRSLTVNSWSATSIGVTFSKGALNYLTGLFLFVVNSQGASNPSGYAVQLEPRVFIRDDFINLQSNPRASETGLRVLVWRALPTSAAPNPAQVLENQTLDAGGNSNWQIARGSLALGDPIWFAVLRDGVTPIATMRKFTPTYE